jgi:D-alanyl-D-alanine endopeptidase (penicillin-binding protein 7)
MLSSGLGAGAVAAAEVEDSAQQPVKASTSKPKAKPGKEARPAHVARAQHPPVKRAAKRSVMREAAVAPSFGHIYGLQHTADQLALKSSAALVIDQDTDEVLFSKNSEAILPIASITKLMTALVVTEAHLPLDETLAVTQADVDATAGSSSRLRPGIELTRGEMLHLALMSSENRAAHVLGRTYPGGVDDFVAAMNDKAQMLGMSDTLYVEPTGLSSSNQSSAKDLAKLVRAAFVHPIIRQLSTSPEAVVPLGKRQVQFHNTNGLVRAGEWEIGLQKTGYIAAAGRCLVMQAKLAGRQLIMVLLDSAGKYSRIGDAERIRSWLATVPMVPSATAATLTQPR